VVHIADYKAEQGYLDNDPLVVAVVELSGARTIMAVPMLEHAENLVPPSGSCDSALREGTKVV
jgi:hypothetical protein